MNRFDLANVYWFRADPGTPRRVRSLMTFDKPAAGDAAENARSWRFARVTPPGRPAAPPRPVGVKE
ncbi:hypothetical protein Acsp01_89240 [Actinoplanes sp. NBRC 101535]|nr:hypothetical protein Acsp01_89240 [Actinoplanes sp. NBRC 101535]